jgi:hypothetical protein
LVAADAYFVPGNKPAKSSDASWEKDKTSVQAVAHRTLGWVAMQENNYEESARQFEQALQLNPADREALAWRDTVQKLTAEHAAPLQAAEAKPTAGGTSAGSVAALGTAGTTAASSGKSSEIRKSETAQTLPTVSLEDGEGCRLNEEFSQTMHDAALNSLLNRITMSDLKCRGGGGLSLYAIDGAGPEGFGGKGTKVGTFGGGKRFGTARSGKFRADLVEGQHTLTTNYGGVVKGFGTTGVVRSQSAVNLTFVAESGHAYTINSVSWGRFGTSYWFPIVFDVTDEQHPRIVPNQHAALIR